MSQASSAAGAEHSACKATEHVGSGRGSRVWRHRDQPALHPQGGVLGWLWRERRSRWCARHPVVDFLVIDLGGVDQVHVVRVARPTTRARAALWP